MLKKMIGLGAAVALVGCGVGGEVMEIQVTEALEPRTDYTRRLVEAALG